MERTIKDLFTDRIRKPKVFKNPSLTQQHFAQDVNINSIIAKFKTTGTMPQGAQKPSFGDFTGIDFQQAQNIIAQANEGFMALPSALRKRFGHDPQNLINFVNNEANRDEAIKLGLINKQQEKIPEVPAKEPSPT